MSRSEMVREFLNGNLSRRDFVRGLVASGVAVGGAAAHAAALQPIANAGTEDGLDDYYNLTSKDQCKDGGYKAFGFKNQGQCIRFVNTGKAPNQASDESEDQSDDESDDQGTDDGTGELKTRRSDRPRP